MVGPNPTPKSSTLSPALAGRHVGTGSNVTVELAMPALLDTTTGTGPLAVSSGDCKLICSGLTKERYAALPLIVTLTLPSEVGNSPFHTAVLLARLLP